MLIASFLSSVREWTSVPSIFTACSLMSVNVSIIPVLLLMTSSLVGVYSSSYSHSKESGFHDASTFSDDDPISPGTIYSCNPWACLLQLVWYAFGSFLKVSLFFFQLICLWLHKNQLLGIIISALVIIWSCWNHSSHCFPHKSSAPPVSTLFCCFT